MEFVILLAMVAGYMMGMVIGYDMGKKGNKRD